MAGSNFNQLEFSSADALLSKPARLRTALLSSVILQQYQNGLISELEYSTV